MKIELTHPITHGGKEYGRGVHDLPPELAKLFLSYDWAARPLIAKEKATTPPAAPPGEKDKGEKEK